MPLGLDDGRVVDRLRPRQDALTVVLVVVHRAERRAELVAGLELEEALRELPEIGEQAALLVGDRAALLIGNAAGVEVDVALVEIVQHARANLLLHQVQREAVVVLRSRRQLEHAEL
jgi:hypothetical protein